MATNFDKAFSAARKSGKKEFSFGGKQYNTKLKGEGGKTKKASLPKKGPVPEKRPLSKPATSKASVSKPVEAKAKASVAAKKPTSAMKQAVRIQTGPQTKSYADRNKEAAKPAEKPKPKTKGLFILGPKTDSYANRNKKPPVRMGSGGGY